MSILTQKTIAQEISDVIGGHPGNPGDIRYWENIIPEHYEITTRQGMSYKTTLNGDEHQPWEYQWHEHTPTESLPHGIMSAEIEIGLEVEVATRHISGETYGWS